MACGTAPRRRSSRWPPKQLRLRQGIREHQRQTGHSLCWLNDLALWRLLDVTAEYPHVTLPVRDEFFAQCHRYYEARLSGVEYEEPEPKATIRVKGPGRDPR